MSNTFPQEILKLLIKSNSRPNSDNLFIFTAKDDLSIICDQMGLIKVWDGKTMEQFTDLEYTLQYDLFCWIQDNQYALKDLMREKLTDIQIDPFDDEGFVSEPQTIFAVNPETLKVDVQIGKIGVVKEILPENNQEFRRVIFVSPDGSHTTITGWYAGSEESRKLAEADLEFAGKAILNFKLIE